MQVPVLLYSLLAHCCIISLYDRPAFKPDISKKRLQITDPLCRVEWLCAFCVIGVLTEKLRGVLRVEISDEKIRVKQVTKSLTKTHSAGLEHAAFRCLDSSRA